MAASGAPAAASRSGRLVIGLARRSFTKANPMPSERPRNAATRPIFPSPRLAGSVGCCAGVEYLPDPDRARVRDAHPVDPAPTGAARSACRAPPPARRSRSSCRRSATRPSSPRCRRSGRRSGPRAPLSQRRSLRRRDRAAPTGTFPRRRPRWRPRRADPRDSDVNTSVEAPGGASTVVAAGAKSSSASARSTADTTLDEVAMRASFSMSRVRTRGRERTSATARRAPLPMPCTAATDCSPRGARRSPRRPSWRRSTAPPRWRVAVVLQVGSYGLGRHTVSDPSCWVSWGEAPRSEAATGGTDPTNATTSPS